MWKKLIVGAVIVVALIAAVAVSYVRAVVGSYHIDLLLGGKVVGSGEFTIRMETFEWSWSTPGYYSARGRVQVTQPVIEFIKLKEFPIERDQLAISDWYISVDGWVELQFDVGSQRIRIQIPDIRGRVSEGTFGYENDEIHDVFCTCRVTRK